MDLTPYVASLRDDLAAAAAVGDEATTRAGSSLAAALEPAVRLALMNALSDLAGEVTEALGDRTVSLRLSGREVKVVVDRDSSGDGADGFFAGPTSSPFAGTPGGGPGGPQRPTPPPPPPPGPGFSGADAFNAAFGGGQGFGGRGGPDVGDISRMTLRLVDQIKGQAERAAASQGMSLNSWIAQAVQGALHDKQRGGGWGGGWGGRDAGWGGARDGGSGSGWTDGRPNDEPAPEKPADTPADEPGDTSGPSGTAEDGPDDGGVDGWVKG
ncbi:toxin-antitoxin system HicB family antitoxin [Actinomycetospora sp. NBC_00405]|uniref:toxin-antitoxin system HicB family antitoxin n=1 Tax=Actinomycetospora sp. NBC_00405 TaxID=2975952 RepID=UPI003FA4C187